ncbi:MAG: gamma-glutamyl-gamma-aminobutyrate hydrolase family protein [Haloechinothrix sp.]
MVSNVSDRPRIGITTYLERASYGVWDQESAILPRSYVDSVVAAGGAPLLLPPVGGAYRSLIAGLDGLVLAGGADVDPIHYGQSPHERTVCTGSGRDRFEFGVLREALAVDLPVLGVCRGLELLNVALGGTLTQHLPDVVGHQAHQPAPALYGTSRIRLGEGSAIAAILGSETKVHCYHHQAIGELATGLSAVGWADDGTVEAVETADHTFVLGVQWHPEENDRDHRLLSALVEAAHRYRTKEGT